jgi:hypothetical protein
MICPRSAFASSKSMALSIFLPEGIGILFE